MLFTWKCVLVLAGTCLASSLWAQAPTSRVAVSYHPYEVAAIFSHVVTDGTFGSRVAMNGFTASGSADIISLAQVTGEVGAYYGRGIALKSFLAGPQATFHFYRLQPFVH